jgi:hypothetical protein
MSFIGMANVDINKANEHALEMGIILSIQQAECGTDMLETYCEEDNDEIIGYMMEGLTETEARLFIFENRHSNVHNKSNLNGSIRRFTIQDFDSYTHDHSGCDFRDRNVTIRKHINMEKLSQKWGSPNKDIHSRKSDHTIGCGSDHKEDYMLHHGLSESYHQSLEASSPPTHPHILHHGLTFKNNLGLKCAHFNHHETPPVIEGHLDNKTPFLALIGSVWRYFIIQKLN